jgi:hypothetical protein
LNVRIQRERDAQFERERAVVEMRQAVVSAVASSYQHRMGSSAVFEAVDEALAQIVAAGHHLAEPVQVKALWITCATRRLIDEQRSAEARHRDAADVEETAHALTDSLCGDLLQLTEDGRQRWRIREILSVLRGEQRRWAEAWFDEILAGSREPGAQPRGLPQKLGWSPSKTKSVSRRARMKMATFIESRVSGAVCEEQRALLDPFIVAGREPGGQALEGERYASVLFHVAGCDECWAAWHARRRSLVGRSRAAFLVPVEAVALAGHELGARLTGLALGAHAQASSLLARVGIGGAAAAGGGAATLGGKATAVCVGVVCAAATVGGEIGGVLPPIAPERTQAVRAARPERAPDRAEVAARRAAQQAAAKAAAPAAPPAPAPAAKVAATATLKAAEQPVVRGTPGDLPPADPSPANASTPPPPPPPPPPAGTPDATFSTSQSGAPLTPPPAAASASNTRPECVPGSLGC